jgi:hypothetical protein
MLHGADERSSQRWLLLSLPNRRLRSIWRHHEMRDSAPVGPANDLDDIAGGSVPPGRVPDRYGLLGEAPALADAQVADAEALSHATEDPPGVT